MHEVSGPLRRYVRDYLVKEQDRLGVGSVEWARKLGVTQSAWSYLRNGQRGITLEVLCRAIIACPALLVVTLSFFGSLVKVHHDDSGAYGTLEPTEGERSDDRQPAMVRGA